MAAALTFQVDDTRVQKKLSQLLGDVKDYSEPFRAAGADLTRLFGSDVFETGGWAAGDPWRALAEATLRARAERRGHYAASPEVQGRILWWTGTLKRGFRDQITPLSLRIYNVVEYFKYHQQGLGLPRRRMLVVTQDVIIRVMERMHEYVRRSVRK